MRSDPPVSDPASRTSVIIPAHDEQASIGRLLTMLLADAQPGEFEIIVACNGCRDRTAEIARTFGADVQVIEIDEASKRAALQVANEHARALPRIYVDADVQLATSDVRALSTAVGSGPVLAAGPERVISFDGTGRLVRRYYEIWLTLPQVRSGLFGRGVIAVSAAGYERIAALPPAMSDDLAMSEAFAADERQVVSDAWVVIRAPRTLRDLLRRRIRVNTGNAQLDQSGGRSQEAKTSWRELLRLGRTQPAGVIVFVGVAVVSKIAARRRIKAGDFSTWLRDESSRTVAS